MEINDLIEKFETGHVPTGEDFADLIRLCYNQENKKEIKILSIGNSFSEDAHFYLKDIFSSLGINVVLGNLVRTGETLQGHLNQVNANANTYTYHKRIVSNGMFSESSRQNTSMEYALLEYKWDFVTLQQASHDSGNYNTYQPYLNNLINHINNKVDNDKLKIALHCCWSYAKNSTNGAFANYNRDQEFMYNAIVDATKKAMISSGIDIIIPNGGVIQMARKEQYLKDQGNELTRDGIHLDSLGQFITALCFFQVIYGKNNKISLFDIEYLPQKTNEIKFLSYLCKIVVNKVINDPLYMTMSE